ncbi:MULTISPECIES: aldehyde dehydrogenase family protein [unclassified Burkholderia]|uniref:aldehyde dehydrogenase family protein n=1 Tax=unclassified Burkholderia TaxID=2613784 RepID=UPI000F582F14|nr:MULTISPECIES: aldehyde dehydrogenase family protein [unclassified Burkholderia]RQS26829.1 aldehyde dehydrogenase family protein [Burkholderia sp. Bp8995]RQS51715.1 aldehyde dehydrogenase family protein [Burkholderia sp. Bp8989]
MQSDSEATLHVFQAYDREQICSVPEDTIDDLAHKLTVAHAVFQRREKWTSTHQRAKVLYKLAELVQQHQQELTSLIAREGGKPWADALGEAIRAVDGIRSAAEELRSFAGREIPMGLTVACENRWAFTTREPIGPVAAISAFNHPLNLIVHQVVPAIAVGCPVIVKPAATTPLSCLRLIELAHQAGVPPEWVQTLITSDNELAQKLATDPRIAYLSFIGSAKVGWDLKSKLPPGTRCTLEHGGAAPAIIDSSADLDQIIEPLAKGAYYHAGQVCVSTQRIFVHDRIFDEFLERFGTRVATLRVGDPLVKETEVGPLILPREVDRVEQWVNGAIASGARVVVGGKRLGNTTYAPTVVVEPSEDSYLTSREIFGPVSCIYRYSNVNDALARANSLPFAFQASVFAQDIDVAMHVAQRIEASAVLVNDHTAFRVDWMPFAGRRQSGYGVGGIKESMLDMTEEKMIVLRRRDLKIA